MTRFPLPTFTGSTCGAGPTICSPASGSFFPVGTTSVTCTRQGATDLTADTFNLTLVDLQQPGIFPPANITVGNAPGKASAVATFSPSAFFDNAPGVTASCTPPSGSTFPVGVTTVACTAVDTSNNDDTALFKVTVNDTEKPVISASNQALGNERGKAGAAVGLAVSATDNVGVKSLTCTPAAGAFFGLGTTGVSCQASDVAGNIGTAAFNVTVNDVEAPGLSIPGNFRLLTGHGADTATATYTPGASDNAPGASAACAPPSGTAFPAGATLVDCTATDSAGNRTIRSFMVVVTDRSGALVALSLAPASFRAASSGPSLRAVAPIGTLVRYTLSEPAGLVFTVERAVRTGRRLRFRALRGSFRHSGRRGSNQFRFTGRLGGRKLAPGSYRLVGTATDASGNRSRPAGAAFTIRP